MRNMYQTVVEMANKYPREFKVAHTEHPDKHLWIKLLAWELHQLDERFGLNGKRGNPNDLSMDAINYLGEGIGFDPTKNDRPITVIDVIGAAGGPNPKPAWMVLNDMNEPTHRGPGAWVKPQPVPGYHNVEPPKEVPPVEVPGNTNPTLINAIQAVENQVKALLAVNEKLAKSLDGLSARLDRGFSIKAKAGWPVGEINGGVDLKAPPQG